MRVLIVKLTSMGDLIQALPALTDARQAIPNIEFDWVVDESFAEIPHWHPAVIDALPTAHRRWRGKRLALWRNKEFKLFVRQLRSRRYDVIIDAQSNFKSAVVTWLSVGTKHGMNSASVREWGAHLVYGKRHAIAKRQLAVDRYRQLFAESLGYALPADAPDFGLTNVRWPEPTIEFPEAPFLVFVQNASWPNKRWHDDHWQQLIERAGQRGYQVLMPWGLDIEKAQAESLVDGYSHARVLPRLSLSDLAALMKASAGAICVDTGLAHLSAALDQPTVTLYGATDSNLIGATGTKSTHLTVDGYRCTPCYKRYCQVGDYQGEEAQCMKTLSVEAVWDSLAAMMDKQALDLVN